MFERSKVDNNSRSAVACELVLDDGREVLGHLMVTSARGIFEELNAPGGFAEFETLDKRRSFIAKGSIRAARSAAVAKVEPLDRRIREGVPFDPHVVLGIPRTADRDTIRRAYHALAKAYHPDRMQAIDLPAEIVDYATAMAKRINAAYSALSTMGAEPPTFKDAPAQPTAQSASQTAQPSSFRTMHAR